MLTPNVTLVMAITLELTFESDSHYKECTFFSLLLEYVFEPISCGNQRCDDSSFFDAKFAAGIFEIS